MAAKKTATSSAIRTRRAELRKKIEEAKRAINLLMEEEKELDIAERVLQGLRPQKSQGAERKPTIRDKILAQLPKNGVINCTDIANQLASEGMSRVSVLAEFSRMHGDRILKRVGKGKYRQAKKD